MRTVAVLVALALSALGADAQQPAQPKPQPKAPPSIQELQRDEAASELKKLFDDLESTAKELSRTRLNHCLRAFGDEAFCGCLNRELPMGADFAVYIRVVTSSKEDIGYAKLDAEWKKVVDRTLIARETCVAERAR